MISRDRGRSVLAKGPDAKCAGLFVYATFIAEDIAMISRRLLCCGAAALPFAAVAGTALAQDCAVYTKERQRSVSPGRRHRPAQGR
jgi:hypothetical protein